MRDKGLDLGMIRYFDDSPRAYRGQKRNFFGFRKMFRDYLTKLNVPFYDVCCPALTGDIYPVRFNDTTDTLERYNGTTWVAFDDQGTLTATATAFAGGGQGSATQLTSGYTNVTTVATAGDSVKLPTAAAGLSVTVKNNGATNLAVFPFTGDSINGGSVNASITLIPGDEKTFLAMDAINWETSNEIISATFISLADGTVGALALRFGSDANNGLYGISDTQLGIAVEGVLVGGADTTGLFTGNISEQVAAAGVTVDGLLIKDGGITATKADITQITSKVTTVVANGPSGIITTFALTDVTDTEFSFTFTNSFITAASVILLTVDMNGGTGHAHTEITPGVGTSTITVTNVGTASFNSAIKIGYLVV